VIKRLLFVCVILFAVPVLGHIVAEIMRTVTEARFADELARFTGRNSLSVLSGLACRPQSVPEQIFAPCITLGHLDLLYAFSNSVAGITLFLLVAIYGAAAVANGSRTRLAAIFPPGILFVLVMLAGIIVLQAIILTATLYVLIYTLTRGAVIGGMFIGAIVAEVIGICVMLAAVIEALRPEPFEITGRNLSRSEQPRLWQFIDDVASKLGVSSPQSVVCGLPPHFFAIAGDAKIRGRRERLLPNTLYLSLPLMRVMSPRELECTMGHELGHFIGEDRAYTSNFVSIFSASIRSLEAIRDHGTLVILPAFMVLALFLEAFGIAGLAVSRKRELEADRFGISVSDIRAYTSSLLRIVALSPLWYSVLQTAAKEGGLKNASATFNALATDFVSSVDRADMLSKIASMRVAHPTDTHPTIAERFRAHGQELNGAESLIDLPPDRSIALVDDYEVLEESLTHELGLTTDNYPSRPRAAAA
jgi:Zn-dependent protease with chaperone function